MIIHSTGGLENNPVEKTKYLFLKEIFRENTRRNV